MKLKTRVVRSFCHGGKNLELILEHTLTGSKFFWLENGELAVNQYALFMLYNPRLKEVIDRLEGLGKKSMTRVEVSRLINQTKDLINKYFRKIRPDLIGGNNIIKKFPVPMMCLYELLADFMPIFEDWKTSLALSKRFSVSFNGIDYYHIHNKIEAVKFLGKIRVSPIGVNQLANSIRSKEDFFCFGDEKYYYPTAIAREAIKRRYGISADNKLYRILYMNLIGRYFHWIKEVGKKLGVLRFGKRIGLKLEVRNMLCDVIRPSEAAKMLKVTKSRLETLLRNNVIKHYIINQRVWVSYSSCTKYMSGHEGAT